MSIKEITVEASQSGQRLDIFCVSQLPQYSRATLQKAIKSAEIRVNNAPSKPRYTVREGDKVTFAVKEQEVPGQAQGEKEAKEVSIPIIYEDDDVLVINKPAGVIVHPAPGAVGVPSVTSWFAKRYPDSFNVGDENRPGIVHRLDQDTSGVLILAKTNKAFDHLKKQFKKRHVKKEYQALVFGIPGGPDGRITKPIGRSRRNPMRRAIDEEGKPAITEWATEATYRNRYALLNVFPYTGRTHQIRVHLHHLGNPIVGDKLYVFKRQKAPAGVSRQSLHALKLTVKLPSGKRKSFTAPLAKDFEQVIEQLNGNQPTSEVPADN